MCRTGIHHFAMNACSNNLGYGRLNPMERFLIGRILVILALAGLALAPISAAVAMPAMTPVPAMAGMDMAADMECCPKQQTPSPDCAKCPFVAMCLTAFGALTASDVAFSFRAPVTLVQRPTSEFALASLAGEPPSRPPRI